LLVIQDSCLYLLTVYPKTGKYGQSSLSDAETKGLLQKLIAARKAKQLYTVGHDDAKNHLVFT